MFTGESICVQCQPRWVESRAGKTRRSWKKKLRSFEVFLTPVMARSRFIIFLIFIFSPIVFGMAVFVMIMFVMIILDRSWWRGKRSWTKANEGRWELRSDGGCRCHHHHDHHHHLHQHRHRDHQHDLDQHNHQHQLAYHDQSGKQWKDSWDQPRIDWRSWNVCSRF